jgi:hypothetical protein
METKVSISVMPDRLRPENPVVIFMVLPDLLAQALSGTHYLGKVAADHQSQAILQAPALP